MNEKFLTVEQALNKQAHIVLLQPFSIKLSSSTTSKIVLMQVKLDRLAQALISEREAIVAKVTPKGFNKLATKNQELKDDPTWLDSPEKKEFDKLSEKLDANFAPIWAKRLQEPTDLIDEHFTQDEFKELVDGLFSVSLKNSVGEEVKDKLIYYIAANFVD